VIAYVFERELPLVREGAAARIEVAGAREPLAARVERVVGTIDPETRRAEVYLAAGASGGLRAGMFARVVIDGDPQDGLAVPATAVLLREGGRSVVYVAGDDLTFEARDVGLGHPVDGRVPVLSGLIGGERVVVRGALLLDATAEQLL
ncbi:MAG: efflux RND transporter periplasmic adaptor subunit, partial [Sandaracinaceae bacterium]|nr:efflux RND transporter periplasmic adaptor subunit [Sandaracinaceae bacterium]